MNLSPRKEPFQLSLGRRGEMIAWNYLQGQGYQILEKNYRCPLGEIDVVAKKDRRLSFIEIKTRTDDGFGRPEESVHEVKQRKLAQVGAFYLKKNKLTDTSASFDVLAITLNPPAAPKFRLISNAFSLGDGAWQP